MKKFINLVMDFITGRGWRYNHYYKKIYLVNISTNEVHLIENVVPACNVVNMSKKNKVLMSEYEILKHTAKLNGCGICMPNGSNSVSKSK